MLVPPERARVELASNDGPTVVTFMLDRGTLAAVSGAILRPGALSITRTYWDRVELVEGRYRSHAPDMRLDLVQVVFFDEALRALAASILRWSELDLAVLACSPIELALDLCEGQGADLRIEMGPSEEHQRGDRVGCTIVYGARGLADAHRGMCSFVVDVSGAHRFAEDLLAALPAREGDPAAPSA